MDTGRYADFYRDKLTNDVLPFWTTHSPDRRYGGYFTCLDRNGGVYDTDKVVWLQGRQVWTLAKMFRCVRSDPEYLELARLGAEFIRDHGLDESGRFYLTLDRTGKPCAKPCVWSDCFCAMGLAEYSAVTDAEWARDLAVKTYRDYQKRLAAGTNPYPELIAAARPIESMVYDMINVNMSLELDASVSGGAGDESLFRRCGLASAEKILSLFVDRADGLIFEHVGPDGSHPDTFEGRLITPGHALECLWFLISAGQTWGRDDIVAAAVDAMGDMLDFGWDKEYGGFFYYLDARGKPPKTPDWDQKHWWVQGEALVTLLMGYKHTGRKEFAQWFEKVHRYTWSNFHDPEHGEWFGYLDRDGRVILDAKGGMWKGCFHVPRTVWLCGQLLEEIKDVNDG